MTTEHKVYIGTGLATFLIIVVGVFLISKQDNQSNTPLLGQEVSITGKSHLPEGTQITYNSNPPAGGDHYSVTAHAGFYDKTPLDGYLIHSLEHGAVILWYDPKLLSKNQIDKLKQIFDQTAGKRIMVPRESMKVPYALSSWGRTLKLEKIDEQKIKAFFDTNRGRGPENAPI